MFFFVLGLPGRFAQWCDAVALALARQSVGPTGLIRAETLEELAINVFQTGVLRGVVRLCRPGARLIGALVENRQRLVVALDDPRQALVDLVLGDGLPLADAVRMVASSCAALGALVTAPTALVLHADRDWPRQATTVEAIARHLQLAVDATRIDEIVRTASADGPAPTAYDAVAWWDGLAPLEQQTVTGALGPYVARGEGEEVSEFTWTGALFWAAGRPAEHASNSIDITGRPHRVIEGPHIMLPPGLWSLSLRVLLSRGAGEHEFSVEVCADRQLAAGILRPQGEGYAGFQLEFALDDKTEHPVTLHIGTLRAAFDGAIALVDATVARRTAAHDPPTPVRTPAKA